MSNPINPKDFCRAINQHFEQTPATEVVRRAEELKPPPGSEPLGMLPEGAGDALALDESRRAADRSAEAQVRAVRQHRRAITGKSMLDSEKEIF